jgi:hypothetical protein
VFMSRKWIDVMAKDGYEVTITNKDLDKLWYRNEHPRSYQKMYDKWIVMMTLIRRTHDPMNPYTIEHKELFRKCIRGRHGGLRMTVVEDMATEIYGSTGVYSDRQLAALLTAMRC